MKTHKLRYAVSSKMAIHFCGVSYNPQKFCGATNSDLKKKQKERCLELLAKLRGRQDAP